MGTEVREAALLSLLRWEKEEKYVNLEIDAAIRRFGYTGADRRFFTALVYGVVEKTVTLDYLIRCFSSLPFDRIGPEVRMILRLGGYQILFLDRVPDSAAVNESVTLAHKYSNRGAAGFVNGVLRHLVRRKDDLPWPEPGSDEYRSVRYACPEWLCRMWRTTYGETKCESLLAAFDRHPLPTLRVNTLKTTRKELIDRLSVGGIPCRPTVLSPDGIALTETVPIDDLPLEEGLCFVQDEASQLCAAAVGARPGETVIDTCACPGGKSFGIGMAMKNEGRLLSFDLRENKLSLVRRGAERLGLTCLKAAAADGTVSDPALRGIADRVLCDVPCSGLGVLAKKPDLRRKKPEDLVRLPAIQYAILESGASYVRPGGTLLYSTCTLRTEENEAVVGRFAAAHPEFVPSSEGMPFGRASVTLFPDEHGTDGFFMARFCRSDG